MPDHLNHCRSRFLDPGLSSMKDAFEQDLEPITSAREFYAKESGHSPVSSEVNTDREGRETIRPLDPGELSACTLLSISAMKVT